MRVEGNRTARRSLLTYSHTLTHTRFRRTRTTGDAYPNYNVREYIRRRAREEFAKQGGGGKSLQAIREDLDVVKRQGAVYALYNRGPVVKSVMDLPK
jgi:hypothetical protein